MKISQRLKGCVMRAYLLAFIWTLGLIFEVRAESDSSESIVDVRPKYAFTNRLDGWRVQIYLDSIGFSPGKIDGNPGALTRQAIELWTSAGEKRDFGKLVALARAEIARPFVAFTVPKESPDYLGKKSSDNDDLPSRKDALVDYVAVRFHTSVQALARLNENMEIDVLHPGDLVQVPHVKPFKIETWTEQRFPEKKFPDRWVSILPRENRLEVRSAGNRVIAIFPFEVDKEERFPTGDWELVEIHPVAEPVESITGCDKGHVKLMFKLRSLGSGEPTCTLKMAAWDIARLGQFLSPGIRFYSDEEESLKAIQVNRAQTPAVVHESLLKNCNSGDFRVLIDLKGQRLYLMAGGRVVIDSPVSSGRAGHLTPSGRFIMSERIKEGKISNLYDVLMPYWMRLGSSARGLHSGHLPGYPASHGCIRLPDAVAALVFGATRQGTEVEILGDAQDSSELTTLAIEGEK